MILAIIFFWGRWRHHAGNVAALHLAQVASKHLAIMCDEGVASIGWVAAVCAVVFFRSNIEGNSILFPPVASISPPRTYIRRQRCWGACAGRHSTVLRRFRPSLSISGGLYSSLPATPYCWPLYLLRRLSPSLSAQLQAITLLIPATVGGAYSTMLGSSLPDSVSSTKATGKDVATVCEKNTNFSRAGERHFHPERTAYHHPLSSPRLYSSSIPPLTSW